MSITSIARNLFAPRWRELERHQSEGEQLQRVVFCDDSIVRGTQLRDNIREFFEHGAKEVHVRISCPPLVYGCPIIGFAHLEDLVNAIGLPKERVCTQCFDGSSYDHQPSGDFFG